MLCIICSHIFRLSACIEAWALIMIGWALKRRIISLDVEASLHSLPLLPLAFPSVVNLNCLLTKRRAAHFSTLLSLYRKVSREPSHACSILDDTLNPIWLEMRSFVLLHPFLLIVCAIVCVHVCACVCVQGGICMCKFVRARADVWVCVMSLQWLALAAGSLRTCATLCVLLAKHG